VERCGIHRATRGAASRDLPYLGRGTRRSWGQQRHTPIGLGTIMRHIMKHYAHHGFRDFVIAPGYKSKYIRDRIPHRDAG
jgi:hypothetical protein